MKKTGKILSLLIALVLILGMMPAFSASADAPQIVEARLITSGMIELRWTQSPTSGTTQYFNRGHNHPDTLMGAGGGVQFAPQNSSDRNNFEVRLNGSLVSMSQMPYYWNIRNYSRNGVRVNQHTTTLRISALTSAQMTAVQNGTSTLTVRVVGNVTNLAGEAVDTTIITPVTYKPYYEKEVRAPQSNVRVRGSEFVTWETVNEAARQVDLILSAMPQAVVANMATNNTMNIFGPGEVSANIPEHRNVSTYDNWDRAEGYGGRTAAASAANVWRYHARTNLNLYPSTYVSNYRDESIFAHEFGHGIQSAFDAVYNSSHPLRQEYMAVWNNMRNNNMWTAYIRDSGNTAGEMWSTLTSVWFNAMSQGNSSNCNTRAKLYTYDRKTYDFFAKIFPHDADVLSPGWTNIPSGSNPSWRDSAPLSNVTSRPIASTPAIADVEVPVGTPLSSIVRPARVQVNFTRYINSSGSNLANPSSGTSAGSTTLPVTWDTSAYNPNVPGTYAITGTFALVSSAQQTGAISNPDNISPVITVKVLSDNICEHLYANWTVVTPADCINAGSETAPCDNGCGETAARTIPALGHLMVDGICSRCGWEEPTEVQKPAPWENVNIRIANGTGNLVIEGNSGTTAVGGLIDIWNYWADSTYYQWRMLADENNEYVQFRRYTTSLASTALAPTGSSATAGTLISLVANSATDASQWWRLELQPNGRYVISNKANPNLILQPVSAASSQRLRLATRPSSIAASDTWRILNNPSGTALEVVKQLKSAVVPGISVDLGTSAGALGLPPSIAVTYADNSIEVRNVVWDTTPYNGNAAGEYNLTGTITLAGMDANPGNVAASITVVVVDTVPFIITFNANGGTGAAYTAGVKAGNALPVCTFTRSNHTFTGWNTAADGSGTAYANGETFATITADMTLYAQWVRNTSGIGPGPIIVPSW